MFAPSDRMKGPLSTLAPLAVPARGALALVFTLAVLAPVALAPSDAHAQGDEASVVEARARFREGVTLYDEGRYEAARAKFKQAYALKQHPDVLLNLGWSSLKSGHPQEAEEAFSNYLRDAKDAPPAKRAEAEKGLAQARAAGGGSGTSPTPAPTSSGGGGTGGGTVSGGGGGASNGGAGNASPNATPTSTGGTPQPGAGAGASQHATPGTDAPAPAAGSGAAVKEPIRIDALLGYTDNYLGAAIGVRGGKVVTQHLYVGGTFVYNFGSSYNVATPIGTEKFSTSAFYLGPEVGWDFVLAPGFTLRPYGGIGFASFNASTTYANQNLGTNSSASNTVLLFWPGATALYDIPNTNFMVGGDVRLLFGSSTSLGYRSGASFGIFLSGGIRL